MKTATSILAVMVLLTVTAFGVPGTFADESPVSPTVLPALYEKSLPPPRALRSMDSPRQGPPGDAKQKHHHQHPGNKPANKKATVPPKKSNSPPAGKNYGPVQQKTRNLNDAQDQ